MGLLSGQAVKALDYRLKSPWFQLHYSNRDFFPTRSLFRSPQKSENVYSECDFTTASFGGKLITRGPGLNRLLPSPGNR